MLKFIKDSLVNSDIPGAQVIHMRSGFTVCAKLYAVLTGLQTDSHPVLSTFRHLGCTASSHLGCPDCKAQALQH